MLTNVDGGSSTIAARKPADGSPSGGIGAGWTASSGGHVLSEPEAQFVTQVGPYIAEKQFAPLLAALRESWSAESLCEFLGSESSLVARLGATCLGYIGESRHAPALAELLFHSDSDVVQAAEDALWSIWMRSSRSSSNRQLARAIKLIGQEEFDRALGELDLLCDAEPGFAEAQHQRGIALHSLERLHDAEDAYLAAFELNPHHFAAAAALGHIAIEAGDLDRALRLYRESLSIHPRQAELAEMVPQLEAAMRRRVVA